VCYKVRNGAVDKDKGAFTFKYTINLKLYTIHYTLYTIHYTQPEYLHTSYKVLGNDQETETQRLRV
jgi:hypothetical protein